MNITLRQAETAITAARKKAQQADTLMDICITDSGMLRTAFIRMGGAWMGAIDISFKKAKTARYFNIDTGEMSKLPQPGGSLL